MDESVNHYDEKKKQYEHKSTKTKRQQVHQYQTKKVEVMEQRKDEILLRKTGSIHRDTTKSKVLRNGYLFCIVEKYPKRKKIQTEMILIKKTKGKGKKIMIGRDCDKRKIYISNKAYTKEAIDEVYKILNGRWK